MSGAFVIDDLGVAQLFSAPTGPLAAKLEEVGAQLEGEMERLLSEAGTGRSYETHRTVEMAASPGEPPAPLTGELRGSLFHELRVGSRGVECVVGSNDPNALHQEFGTAHMLPRPFMRPALHSGGE